jgi:carbamoyltransferase
VNILGLWDGHDSGAALLVDGRLAAAVNEERLTRRKLEVCFPLQSIDLCLSAASLSWSDIDVVCVSTSDPARALTRTWPAAKERYYQIRRRKARPTFMSVVTRRVKQRLTRLRPTSWSRAMNRRALLVALRQSGRGPRVIRLYDHHECHALCAAVAAGVDPCLVLTVDGLGDGVSATTNVYRDGRLIRIQESPAAHSIGVFFEHVTHLLNMRELEDEGKVMALSEYATPVPDEENPLLRLVSVDRGRIRLAITGARLARRLKDLLWGMSNEQFAFMAQRTVERTLESLARDAVAESGIGHLALAGGVASNIKATRLVRHLSGVESVHVFPHMGDGGLALGAAIAGAREQGEQLALDFSRLDFGPSYTQAEFEAALAGRGLPASRPSSLPSCVARLLAQEALVVWFEGAMEYGPRALGHRSVLTRPDRPALRDRLNRFLKRRAWYQPFCPSLLESEAPRLLSDWDGPSLNPHMTMAYMVKAECRAEMAGVIGPDGSCRAQIVPDTGDGPYARLLGEMKRTTGTGAVLNTSLNIHGQPIACRPEDAVTVFADSGADALVLGPFLVAREGYEH